MAKTPEQIAEERIQQALESQTTELDLSRLGLTTLPESIGELRDVQSLRLFENRLEALPESIGQLSELKSLRLWGNRLRALPESISQLSGLSYSISPATS